MPLPRHPLPTTIVGSYPQPEWLVDQFAMAFAEAVNAEALDFAPRYVAFGTLKAMCDAAATVRNEIG